MGFESAVEGERSTEMDEAITEALRANLDEEIEALQKLQGIAEEFDYQELSA